MIASSINLIAEKLIASSINLIADKLIASGINLIVDKLIASGINLIVGNLIVDKLIAGINLVAVKGGRSKNRSELKKNLNYFLLNMD